MADIHTLRIPPTTPERSREIVPSGVFAMIIFVVIELMMFAGLISAYQIVREGAPGGIWPPPGQPRLPVENTAINTAALIVSGLTLFLAGRRFRRSPASAGGLLLGSILLGGFFVVFQGVEWVGMLRQGLTMTSSTHGAFFYLIVGAHGLHAVIALGVLVAMYLRNRQGRLTQGELSATAVFWYFVVGLWPFLYMRVYI